MREVILFNFPWVIHAKVNTMLTDHLWSDFMILKEWKNNPILVKKKQARIIMNFFIPNISRDVLLLNSSTVKYKENIVCNIPSRYIQFIEHTSFFLRKIKLRIRNFFSSLSDCIFICDYFSKFEESYQKTFHTTIRFRGMKIQWNWIVTYLLPIN
jgi:hypothetical protein